MQPSDKCIDLIKRFEGRSLNIYLCPALRETIGYGHMLTKDERTSGIFKDGITQQQAHALLFSDAQHVSSSVNDMVKVELTQNQFDALVSFVFNVGVNAFKKSTLLRKLNEGKQPDEVAQQFMRWVYIGSEVSEGLKNRRKEERKMFLGLE